MTRLVEVASGKVDLALKDGRETLWIDSAACAAVKRIDQNDG